MSIRFPLKTVLAVTHSDQGTGSVAGGWAYNFTIPQDTDNVVVKVLPSVVAGGLSVFLQTTDDGNTWYDVGRTSIASNSGATAASPMSAQWLTATTIGPGVRTATTFAGASIVAGGIGSAPASTLASGQISGMPLLSQTGRVFLVTTGNATTVQASVLVSVNQQSATA